MRVWSRHATRAAAERARARQRDGGLHWHVVLTDESPPWALVFTYFHEEDPPMTPRLQPGPIRDALAILSEHTRGGEALTVEGLRKRTGLSFNAAATRLNNLAQRGLAAHERGASISLYTITPEGQAMLDA